LDIVAIFLKKNCFSFFRSSKNEVLNFNIQKSGTLLFIPAVRGLTNKIVIQAGPGIKQDSISKVTNTKRAVDMAMWYSTCLASTRS
jgi:hypothetical protein